MLIWAEVSGGGPNPTSQALCIAACYTARVGAYAALAAIEAACLETYNIPLCAALLIVAVDAIESVYSSCVAACN